MSFILSQPQNEISAILLSYKKGLKKPFRYSIGQSIIVAHWDKINQRAIINGLSEKEKANNKFINSEIERYDTFLEQTISYARLHRIEITNDFLFTEFEKNFKTVPNLGKGKITDFFILVDIFIADAEKGVKTTSKGTKISNQRISHYRTFKKNLAEFRTSININDINFNFYKDYIAHRNNQNKAINTIGKELNILKVILRETYKQGLHNNKFFEDDNFKSFSQDVENVYLSDSEIDLLWNLRKLNPIEQRCLDVFIIGCYTGLRISDLSNLDKSQIDNKTKLLKVITEKTKEIVHLPLHWRILEIMKKYNGEFPKAFSDQYMNTTIKDICKKIKVLQTKMEFIKTVGGVVERYKCEKWEKISNHTARRSFATNLYLSGFDTISIMKLTGHQSEKSFMKYICVTQEQVALKMTSHPYFNKKR